MGNNDDKGGCGVSLYMLRVGKRYELQKEHKWN